MFYYGARLRKSNSQTSHELSLSFSATQNRAANTVVTLNDFKEPSILNTFNIMYLLAWCALHFLGGIFPCYCIWNVDSGETQTMWFPKMLNFSLKCIHFFLLVIWWQSRLTKYWLYNIEISVKMVDYKISSGIHWTSDWYTQMCISKKQGYLSKPNVYFSIIGTDIFTCNSPALMNKLPNWYSEMTKQISTDIFLKTKQAWHYILK